MKKDYPTLDLHGVYYVDLEDVLSNFFFWDGHKEAIIITGQSYDMQQKVIEWLEEYDYTYHIPYNNEGRIIVR